MRTYPKTRKRQHVWAVVFCHNASLPLGVRQNRSKPKAPMGSTNFIAPAASPAAMGPQGAQLSLNGFRLTLSADTLVAYTYVLPGNSGLRDLRRCHPDWFLWWREGIVYALARVPKPSTSVGAASTLACRDHLAFSSRSLTTYCRRSSPRMRHFAYRASTTALRVMHSRTHEARRDQTAPADHQGRRKDRIPRDTTIRSRARPSSG